MVKLTKSSPASRSTPNASNIDYLSPTVPSSPLGTTNRDIHDGTISEYTAITRTPSPRLRELSHSLPLGPVLDVDESQASHSRSWSQEVYDLMLKGLATSQTSLDRLSATASRRLSASPSANAITPAPLQTTSPRSSYRSFHNTVRSSQDPNTRTDARQNSGVWLLRQSYQSGVSLCSDGATLLQDARRHPPGDSAIVPNTTERKLEEGVPTGKPSPFVVEYPRAHAYLFILHVVFSNFIAMAAWAQTLVPQLLIAAHLGEAETDLGLVAWHTSAYLVALGSAVVVTGRLGDLWGHKKMLLSGLFTFGGSSLVAGFGGSVGSSGSVVLNTFRALQGIGAAIMLPNCIALLGKILPPGRGKDVAFALFAGSGPLGFVSSAALSATFAEYVSWPWSFWCIAAVVGSHIITSALVIPVDDADSQPWWTTQKGFKFDYFGAVFGIVGLGLLAFALQQAYMTGWRHHAYLYVTLAVGIVCVLLFLELELRIVDYPLLATRVPDSATAFAILALGLTSASFAAEIYHLLLLLEMDQQQNALTASAKLTPVAVSGFLSALVAGVCASKIKPTLLVFIASVLSLAGPILLATLVHIPTDSKMSTAYSYWAYIFTPLVLAPIGTVVTFAIAMMVLSDVVALENQGINASLICTFLFYGMVLGDGIAKTVSVQTQSNSPAGHSHLAVWWLLIGLNGAAVVATGLGLARRGC
jgi:MFS family permease